MNAAIDAADANICPAGEWDGLLICSLISALAVVKAMTARKNARKRYGIFIDFGPSRRVSDRKCTKVSKNSFFGVNHLSIEEGHQDAGLMNLHGVDFEQIMRKDDQIPQHPGDQSSL